METIIEKKWYDNGQLWIRATYNEDGRRDGIYERWFEDGQLALRTNYKDGWPDGLHEEWNSDGKMRVRANYKDGKENSLYELWGYNNDLIKRTLYYGDGKRKSLPINMSLQELVNKGKLDKKYLY